MPYGVYKEKADQPPITPVNSATRMEAPDVLPEELVQAMRQAVEHGDMTWFNELIRQVEKIDSVMARSLQELADRFDYEELTKLLGKEKSDE